jgi:hypothetical protein
MPITRPLSRAPPGRPGSDRGMPSDDMPAAQIPATARVSDRTTGKPWMNRCPMAPTATNTRIRKILVNSCRPYCWRNLISSRFMQALVITNTIGSQAASVVLTPRSPARREYAARTYHALPASGGWPPRRGSWRWRGCRWAPDRRGPDPRPWRVRARPHPAETSFSRMGWRAPEDWASRRAASRPAFLPSTLGQLIDEPEEGLGIVAALARPAGEILELVLEHGEGQGRAVGESCDTGSPGRRRPSRR